MNARRTPEFTNDWFEQSAQPVWEKELLMSSITRVLEIGSYEGKVPCYLMNRAGGTLEIHCVDPWEGVEEGTEARFLHNIAVCRGRHIITVHKGRSDKVLPELLRHRSQFFDLIYVDGSHKAADVLTDAVLSYLLLRPGGILAFDDYLWQPDFDARLTPKVGIDSFLAAFHGKVRITVMTNTQVWVQKA